MKNEKKERTKEEMNKWRERISERKNETKHE